MYVSRTLFLPPKRLSLAIIQVYPPIQKQKQKKGKQKREENKQPHSEDPPKKQ